MTCENCSCEKCLSKRKCCICDGCFDDSVPGETLGQHEFCRKHRKMIKKILKLSEVKG